MKLFFDKLKTNNAKILAIILFTWSFTIIFYFALFTGLNHLVSKALNKKIELNSEKSFSVYKPGIDILSGIKEKKRLKYIQRIYIHPFEKNKIMIMIKPNCWGTMTDDEKNQIKTEILKKWQKIYINSDKTLYPEACFANIS
ncbi:MAG TPA: hypothetical protein P5556_09670 [Candidatus Gastranaerophilales bacterium]|nr:hypothetical protein [Candidatus Gastranaerophilales bacterium]